MLDATMQDVRYAVRGLRATPGFAAVATLSLALGIGAHIVIFSLVDAVIWKYLPVVRPAELMQLQYGAPDWNGESSSFAEERYALLSDPRVGVIFLVYCRIRVVPALEGDTKTGFGHCRLSRRFELV